MEGVPLDAVVREYSLQRQLAAFIHRAAGLCSKEAAGKRGSMVKEAAWRRGTCTPWLLCAGSGLLPKQHAVALTCRLSCRRRPKLPNTKQGT